MKTWVRVEDAAVHFDLFGVDLSEAEPGSIAAAGVRDGSLVLYTGEYTIPNPPRPLPQGKWVLLDVRVDYGGLKAVLSMDGTVVQERPFSFRYRPTDATVWLGPMVYLSNKGAYFYDDGIVDIVP